MRWRRGLRLAKGVGEQKRGDPSAQKGPELIDQGSQDGVVWLIQPGAVDVTGAPRTTSVRNRHPVV